MTPVPYALKAESNEDGSFDATLTYGATVVAEVTNISRRKLEGWARAEAQKHKASISPSEYHFEKTTVEKTIVL